jgi:DNA invertase Pin-like site-specific DNA recombinase
MGALAEFEKNLIRERVVAGIEAARKRGKKLGRPRVAVDVGRVRELRDAGLSWREVSRKMGVPLTTLRRAIKE